MWDYRRNWGFMANAWYAHFSDNLTLSKGLDKQEVVYISGLAFEKRVVQAVAILQQETNAPITFHPGRNPASPFEIIKVFTEAGGRGEDVIMSHLDRNGQ